MRWKYLDERVPQETEFRRAKVDAIDRWWQEFAAKRDDIMAAFSRHKEWDLPSWIIGQLEPIAPGIMWEFGPAEGGGYRLVLTPEHKRSLRPLVEEVVRRAPALDGWTFLAHRVPEPIDSAFEVIAGRTGARLDDATVAVEVGPGRRLDVRMAGEFVRRSDDQRALGPAFVAIEVLAGEQRLNDWIGEITVMPARPARGLRRLFARGPAGERPTDPIAHLCDLVEQAIESIRSTMPDRPLYELDFDEGQEWVVYEGGGAAPDEDGCRHDVIIGTIFGKAMVDALAMRGSFASERFSRCDETFAFVQIESRVDLSERVRERNRLMDAMDAALRQRGCGCSIGGATGARYNYIDLALSDIDGARTHLRDIVIANDCSERSWLLFHDAVLAAEWIGLHPNAPHPPTGEANEGVCL